MTPKPHTVAARHLLAVNDGKPTQINEHKRAFETRINEHEPHAMARQTTSRQQGRAQ